MVHDRVLRTVGSTVLLVGAFAIGWALHQTVVLGARPVTDPVVWLAVGGGIVLAAAGWRLERRFDPLAYVRRGETEPGTGESFDESVSPVSEEALEELDREE
ncbi:MAG: hypothetical protein ABEJ71_00735 [Halodesulfurarchaeum sp.]